MMGQQVSQQNALFYDFCIEQHMPPNRLLECNFLCEHLACFHNHKGRPSIDPEQMLRMLIVGYCYDVRSERQLCDEVHLIVAFRFLSI